MDTWRDRLERLKFERASESDIKELHRVLYNASHGGMTLSEEDKKKIVKELLELYCCVKPYKSMFIHIAKECKPKNVPVEDAIGAAVEGVVKAIEKFNPDHGTQFFTYAYLFIKGAIKKNCPPRVISPVLERALPTLLNIEEELTQDLGRPPTREEIRESVKGNNISEATLNKYFNGTGYYKEVEIDTYQSNDESEFPSIADTELEAIRNIDGHPYSDWRKCIITRAVKKDRRLTKEYVTAFLDCINEVSERTVERRGLPQPIVTYNNVDIARCLEEKGHKRKVDVIERARDKGWLGKYGRECLDCLQARN